MGINVSEVVAVTVDVNDAVGGIGEGVRVGDGEFVNVGAGTVDVAGGICVGITVTSAPWQAAKSATDIIPPNHAAFSNLKNHFLHMNYLVYHVPFLLQVLSSNYDGVVI